MFPTHGVSGNSEAYITSDDSKRWWDNEEFKVIIDLTRGYRQRVREWLHILSPGEFPKDKIPYKFRKSR